MKRNKFYMSLIAVLLVISLLPTAAFAATLACGHGDVAEYTDNGVLTGVKGAAGHQVMYTTRSECRECGNVTYSYAYEIKSHYLDHYKYSYNYEDSGDTIYVFNKICVCGYAYGTHTSLTPTP